VRAPARSFHGGTVAHRAGALTLAVRGKGARTGIARFVVREIGMQVF
jgi:hypothetical protein